MLKFIKICIVMLFMLFPNSCTQANSYYEIIYNEVSAFNNDPIQIDWTTNAIIYAAPPIIFSRGL